MPSLINHEAVLENNLTVISNIENGLPSGNALVEFNVWLENKDQLDQKENISFYLSGDTDLEQVKPYLGSVSIIGINFPAFADGRGYSLARLLKERYDYKGEVRAIGDVLIDQLYFMKRCGFDTFEIKDNLNPEKALSYLATFAEPYQLAFDKKEPLFRRNV